MSTLMFWNKQNSANNNNNNEVKNGKRNWLHAPDSLLNGHVVYLVKFFGSTPVEKPKGIEVVKDAIRRLQFAQQMKKAETGSNAQIKKVEITISVDGLAIQEPRTQKILHQFPLHNISYCADEEGVKKFFSFIAKAPTPNSTNTTNDADEGHECFVFISSKLASDITLTIGQAFDLAYRRFMNDSAKGTELSKAQAQIKQLEGTVATYKLRLKEISDLVPKADLEKLLMRLGIRDICELSQESNTNNVTDNNNVVNANKKKENIDDTNLLIETTNTYFANLAPKNIQTQINDTLGALKTNGQKAEELLLNSDSDSDFDPRADENCSKSADDLFGFEPPKTFGQQLFANQPNNNSIINNNNNSNNKYISNNSAPQTSPPPLLAPPPKVAAPRRGNSVVNQGGTQDLFGSAPFNPNDTSTGFNNNFNPKQPSLVDDFSLESLDPLRK